VDNRRPTILISGAGIAGSCLAALLAPKGFRVTLVERARELRSSGMPVDVEDAAFGVAERMGVLPRLRDAATCVKGVVFVGKDGRRVAGVNLSINDKRCVEVPRSDLAHILYEAAVRAGEVEVLFDDSVVAIDQDEGGVDVAFERAAARRFDCVVGCDGLHSNVRRIAFGPEEDFAEPLGMYVATFPFDGTGETPAEVVIYNVPDKALSVHPGTGKGRAIAAFFWRRRGEAIAGFDGRDAAGNRKLLENEFADAGWRSRELLETLAGVEDFYCDSVSRIRLGGWWKGRVALLGDAASCVSFLGGGSSNAIAGADVLARALAEATAAGAKDPAGAFARYERTHRPTVEAKGRGASVAGHFLIPATAGGIAARNLFVRALSVFRGAS
jgi:2-polyprenyl-6-methoxyphenol hydroxylase-like FAD-dependent oxidoreductase